MKSGKRMDSSELNLIMVINALEHSGNAPHTVEALKKIYWETYESIPQKAPGQANEKTIS